MLALPYGGGGNTTAYGLGFVEIGQVPRFLAVEAAQRATTEASAIRITDPVHVAEVGAALDRAGGEVVTLDDAAIIDAWRMLAHEEGVFYKPASAAGLAGVIARGVKPGSTVVCVITGNGLKDPEIAARLSPEPVPVDPDPDAIAAAAA